jgi:hypothetical protein
MERNNLIKQFYSLLNELKNKTGFRYLKDCRASLGWPKQGVYFFFEEGEIRQGSNDLRVVRVGTHALKAGSATTLWKRLRQHRGNLGGELPGGGNHRGSIFRLHVGTALINKENLNVPTWAQGNNAGPDIRTSEHFLECKVSQVIGNMPFLWLKVEDPSGPQSLRGYIERNAISLLSNYMREPIDPPSKNWLGNYCANSMVRESGLWNVDHVQSYCDPVFIGELTYLIRKM